MRIAATHAPAGRRPVVPAVVPSILSLAALGVWLAALSASLAFAPAARAAIIHVPGDYPTIQQGINAASVGDIVMVAAGEYFEEITLRAGVIVQGAGEDRSIVNGGGDWGDVVSAIGNDIQVSTKLIGFTITGAISGGGLPGGAGLFCNSGASPEIANSRFTGNDFGIATWNGAAPSLHNNVIVANTYTGLDISSRPTVVNNTIVANGSGIYDGGGYRPPIMNNIVASNTTRGIGATNPGQPTDLTYNDVWGNGQNYYNCTPGVGSISADPLFRDALGRDFHLLPGSPCIDAGNPLPQYNDGDGTRNDMGAYGGPGAESPTPEVTLTVPPANALDAAIDTDALAVFSADMNAATLSAATFLLRGDASGFHAGIVSYDAGSKTATIDPAAGFRVGEEVTALLTTAVEGSGGESLGGFGWQFTCAAADGSGEYEIRSEPDAGLNPEAVIAADFNNDGLLDLACGHNAAWDHVTILIGSGDGAFVSGGNYTAAVEPHTPVAGDFDRDGDLDLAVACGMGGSIAVLSGNGDGSFGPPSLYGFAGLGGGLAAGDIDADGDIDLVVANLMNRTARILFGAGDGSFTWGDEYPTGYAPNAIDLADLDGDGALDLLVVNTGDSNVSVRLGGGDGTFGGSQSFAAGISPAEVDVADLNGDGNLDLAVASTGSNSAAVLIGDGSGGFGMATVFPVQSGPHGVRAADVDADGDLDLALDNQGQNTVSILRNHGDATFAAAVNYACGVGPTDIATGDFDEDGDLDLCTTNSEAGTVTILENKDALGISALEPGQNSIDVLRSTNVRVVFDAAVDPASIGPTTVRLWSAQSGLHSASLSYDGGDFTLTLDTDRDFVAGEAVTTVLTTGLRGGNGTAYSGFVWSFTAEVPVLTRGALGNLMSFNVGNDPRGAFAADYDNDGDVDLAIGSASAYPNPGAAVILMNRGDGTFLPPVGYSLGAPDPIDVFAADLNSDGWVDLAFAHNEPGTSHLNILTNDGDGTFTRIGSYAPAILGQAVTGGDLDADGDIDLVMTDGWGSSANVHVLYNSGSATFGVSRTCSAGTFARDPVVTDADNDGDADLAVANGGNDNVSVLYNDGAGAFPRLANYAVGSSPSPLCANDLDGDGWVDLAAGCADGVRFLRGQGDGTFGSAVAVPISGAIQSISWGDLDGDGDLDLAACSFNDNLVWVSRNDGAGLFGAGVSYPIGPGPWGLEAADYDRNGTLDLACPIWDANRADVLYGMIAAGVEDAGIAALRPGLTIMPNPFRASATISFTAEAGGRMPDAVHIYDVAGRLVRTGRLAAASGKAAGAARFTWNGEDDSGRRVGAGVYFCRPSGARGDPLRLVRIR